MTPAQITAEPLYARTRPQYDYRGEPVPEERQRFFEAELPVTCSTPDKTISLGFMVRTEVDLVRLPNLEKRDRISAVASALAEQSGTHLPRLDEWELYKGQYIHLPGDAALSPPVTPARVVHEVQLNDLVAGRLREATTRHRETAEAFERAKDYLESSSDFFHHDASAARSAAHFITDCIRADAESSSRGHASSLLGIVEDLIKRKKTNHPGYESRVSRLRSILYRAEAPTVFDSYPPQARLLSL